MTTGAEHRLSLELSATADALRHVRQQVARLVYESNVLEGIAGPTRAVLVEGLAVADALEALADRLKPKE